MQAHRLLVHGDLVGKDGCLRQDAGLVDGGGGQHLPHLALQSLPVGRHRLGRLCLHTGHGALDGIGPAGDILRQLHALHTPHPVIGRQRRIRHLTDVLRQHLQILLRLGDGEDVRAAGQLHRSDLSRQAEGLLQLQQRLIVAAGQRLVHLHHGHVRSGGVDGDEHVHLAP